MSSTLYGFQAGRLGGHERGREISVEGAGVGGRSAIGPMLRDGKQGGI